MTGKKSSDVIFTTHGDCFTRWDKLLTPADRGSGKLLQALRNARGTFAKYARLRTQVQGGFLIDGTDPHPFRWGAFKSNDLLFEDSNRLVVHVLESLAVPTLSAARRALRSWAYLHTPPLWRIVTKLYTEAQIRQLTNLVSARCTYAWILEMKPEPQEALGMLAHVQSILPESISKQYALAAAEALYERALDDCADSMRCALCFIKEAGPLGRDRRRHMLAVQARSFPDLTADAPHVCIRPAFLHFDAAAFVAALQSRSGTFAWADDACPDPLTLRSGASLV